MVPDLFRYRSLIWQRAIMDLRHRYAGTGLGVVWNVVHPLALIAVYSAVFTLVYKAGAAAVAPRLAGNPLGYTLFLCAGFLPWLALADSVTRGTAALVENAAYLKKIALPEQVFIASAAMSATLGLAISFTLLVVISLALGLRPAWTWLLVPLPLLSLQAIGWGAGLLLGTINVFLRDVGQLVTIALQLLFWTVPIAYPANQLPPALQRAIAWHPLVPAFSAIRMLFLDAKLPGWTTWIGLAIWPLLAIAAGAAVFSKLRPEIRDVI